MLVSSWRLSVETILNSSSGAPQRLSPRSTSSEVSKKNPPQPTSPEVSQKISPRPRVVRQLKTGSRYSDHTASSANLANRAPKEQSPKVADHKSPKSPASEKKRQSRVSELESQISQLENDLKTVKDQLCSTEASKKQAQKDAEESNKQLLALSVKLEESRKQLLDQSASENVLCKNSEEQNQALVSALDEIKQLKAQLETVAESESTQNELDKLNEKLVETNAVLEEMKNQLRDCKESEAQAKSLVGDTLVQLETAKKLVETLKSDGLKAVEGYDAIASELDQSRARVNFLEDLVSKLKAEISSENSKHSPSEREESLGIEVNSAKLEIEQLKSTLEAAEIRYNEEQAKSKEQIRNAFEMVEKVKYESGLREAELETELRKYKYEIEELKANLMDKETELQGICEENESITVKLENSLSGQRGQELETQLENLKARLAENETEWVKMSDENEKLKIEIDDISKAKKASDEAASDIEAAKAAEHEALMKVGYMTEEVDKSNRKVKRVSEQLEAVQAVNAEMEGELRRLKVQSDQWRKAAEAAAAMVVPGNNNGQVIERTGSLDSNYSPRMGMSSPYGDDVDDDDLMKKKNANMLRRFGVLWKKPHK
ncbi:hypothetical protein BUALT_Bualt13G0081300 [Buddleja alternifolia]|uniref:Interactor of constitutive active ROPs 3 n=1 Tax=Buddleja alternifolia TaxID=168488 RepID=A0AAV6WR67_9LAMI|nr:hypothetical protein BUALT_Bualt13G0081300 [Buddleja alternifolia]